MCVLCCSTYSLCVDPETSKGERERERERVALLLNEYMFGAPTGPSGIQYNHTHTNTYTRILQKDFRSLFVAASALLVGSVQLFI